jgi:hypothetical protein
MMVFGTGRAAFPPHQACQGLHSFIMRAALLSLAMLPLLVSAQDWCPPGATWHHTCTNGWAHDGYARYTHVGDTGVGGVTAQHIDQYVEGTAFSEPFAMTMAEPVITADLGDLVTIWNGQGFDTLFHFAALPGDSWRLAPSGSPTTFVTVLDTGTLVVGGLSLRFLVTDNDTIVERLGALQRVLPPWPVLTLDANNGPLRCYSDVDIQFQAASWDFGCASFTSVAERSENNLLPFPNPGSTHFTLELSHPARTPSPSSMPRGACCWSSAPPRNGR